VTQVGQLADGTYVVAGRGLVSWRDAAGHVSRTVDGFGFAMAADRRSVVVYGPQLLVVKPDETAPVTLATINPDRRLGFAEFSPDGRAVAFATSTDDDAHIAVMTVADQHVTNVLAGARAVPESQVQR
jgi:hypothetical protein